MTLEAGKTLHEKPTILVVDDDDALRRLINVRLSDTYLIVDAPNPERALELVLQDRPDCILLDLMMPRHSGLQLCQTLASLNFTQKIPIFVMTGQSAEAYKEFCLNLGARDFFEKPLDFKRLRSRIEETLNAVTEERRAEPRLRLRTSLILRGIDKRGEYFEVQTSTGNVSNSGFGCAALVSMEKGAVVEVELLYERERLLGRAEVVRVDPQGQGLNFYGFRITEKYGEWTLN